MLPFRYCFGDSGSLGDSLLSQISFRGATERASVHAYLLNEFLFCNGGRLGHGELLLDDCRNDLSNSLCLEDPVSKSAAARMSLELWTLTSCRLSLARPSSR
jgi:hypothetical protein